MTRAKLPISIAFWDYDRTLPLVEGRVAIEGCAPSFALLQPEDAFARAFGSAEFDVTEISLANYITALASGGVAYAAIPVFLSRAFRLGTIYVRNDRYIRAPRDLAGKRVGLQEFGMTAAVVARGMLSDTFGLETRRVKWRVGGVEHPAPPSPSASAPPGFDIESVADRSLDAMLADGDLDALMSLRVPPCFAAGHPRIKRLFPDWRAAEQEYYRATGVFPIMHAVGVRRSLLAAHPWLAQSLFNAFLRAKALAVADLLGGSATGLPWAAEEIAVTRALMGADFWPYGVAANRAAIAAMLRWSKQDGLQRRPLATRELFVPSALDL